MAQPCLPPLRDRSLRDQAAQHELAGEIEPMRRESIHDVAPANGLGLKSVWINRLGERPGPRPTRELPDLSGLPDALEEVT